MDKYNPYWQNVHMKLGQILNKYIFLQLTTSAYQIHKTAKKKVDG
jgi:D-alanyl-lipoteichoic acid acyltransferase DltB (MBOAT superfamily)